jgi:hypothetical protein
VRSARLEIAYFLFRGKVIRLDMIDSEPRAFAMTCPCCGTRGRLSLLRHRARIELLTGALSVENVVICPNAACGWSVRIQAGVATESEPVDFGLSAPPPRKSNVLPWPKEPRPRKVPARWGGGRGRARHAWDGPASV